jgi:branched-chain amino acid transport system substrate-binding protein
LLIGGKPLSNNDPIKVGVLFSREGVTSRIENTMLAGTLFAIREINDAGGILGRELVPVYHDPRSNPQLFRSLAIRLVQDDKVNVIFGCYMSSTRKAVLPVVEQWNRLLFCPTMYEGFEYSNNIIYTGGAPNQNSALLAEFMSSRFGARVYMVGSDYIFPYESNRIMSDFVHHRQGGAKVGERYVHLDAQESALTPIIRDIKAKQPDFIFSTVVGKTTRMLYQAYADAGLDPQKMPIASLCTSEEEISEMGLRVAQGHYTAGPYFQSIDTPRNRNCVALFRKLFGTQVQPNMSWEASYNQVHVFAGAFRDAGSDEYHILLPHVLGREFDAPQGRIRILPHNHHSRLFPRIGRVGDDGQFTILAETPTGVDADPYLVSHSFDDWSTRLRMSSIDDTVCE